MKIEILTIFPDIFHSFLSTSLIQKGIEKKLFSISIKNIRDFSSPPHFRVDDTPYGGGPGMVLMPEPLGLALDDAKKHLSSAHTLAMSASGKQFNQAAAFTLSKQKELIIVCGRYEGIDQRILDTMIDAEYSIGDFVTMGGEAPAMAVIEAIVRLLPGVLGNDESTISESFQRDEEVEYAHYTKPQLYRGHAVPEVLLSGNHKKIEEWRESSSEKKKLQRKRTT